MCRVVLQFLLICFFITNLYANEKVVLQLKWFHQFQFAGYYAAKEQGFYDEVGLDVEIRERDLKYNNVEQVINNEAQYGVSDSILILYKSKKQSVVIVSPIFQHSANALISLKSSGIDTPYDLNNKTTLFYPNDTDGFSLLAMMKRLDVQPNLIRKREKNDYIKLMTGEVEVIPVYLSNEPFYFQEKNIDINILNPTNYGFDFYGDILFTNQKEVQNHPERVKKFKQASLKGWKYALEHKDELIELIHKKYNTTKSIEHLRYEANAIEKLISKDVIPLGTIDQGRIRFLLDLYREYGILTQSFNVKEFVFSEYTSKTHLSLKERKYLENKPSLKVLNLPSFPPYSFNENNTPSGYSVDYIKLLANKLGVNIEFVSDKSWKQALEMIKNNEIDIIPHIAVNTQREKFIAYSSFKQFDYQVSFATRKENIVKTIADLKGKKLAILHNSFLQTLFEKYYPDQELFLASTVRDAVDAVSNGKAYAVIDELSTLEYIISKHWFTNLKTLKIDGLKNIPVTTPLYFGVPKKSEVLTRILEKANNVISLEELSKLRKKWFVQNNDYIDLTKEEYRFLEKKKKLQMCISPSWLPYEDFNKKEHSGVISEYIKIFEKSLPIKIEVQTLDKQSFLSSKNLQKRCDFLPIMLKTQERRENFNFTKPFMVNPLVVSTKLDKPFISDIRSFLSHKFSVVKGSGYKKLLEKKFPKIKIVEVHSTEAALEKVLRGEVYGFIDVLPIVGYSIQKNYVGNLKIAGKLDLEIGFPFATAKNLPLLHSIFNKVIETLTQEQQKQFINKWLSIKYEEKVDYKTLIYFGTGFLLILVIIIIKNRTINDINNTLTDYVTIVDKHILTSSTDKRGKIISVSQAFCDVSGYSKEELIGKKHSIVKHEDMPDELFKNLWATISSKKVWQGEIKNKKKNGEIYWVDATISPNFDKYERIIGYTAIRMDITDKKKIEELSITDELTTLYNKRYFNEVLEREINRSKRLDEYFGFIMLDIDFFKQYNDYYGHQKGDEVLKSMGKLLKKLCQRATETPFRIGGEEFGIIFIPRSYEEALDFVQKVNEEIESLKIEHTKSTASKYITASIGLYIAKGKKIGSDEDIYNFADKALYVSKENGRNRFTVYK